MKKGMILYVTQGKEDVPLQGAAEMTAASRSLGVAAVSVAVSEEDMVFGWWRLLAGGVQQVLFMAVTYDPVRERFESLGNPVRLCG